MPTQSNDFESADSVAITFEMQKNNLKHDTVIHGRTDDSTESGLTQVLRWILRCVQFGEMVAWNTLPPNLSCNTCNRPAVHMEALVLALNLTKWVLTRCDQKQRWKCISEKFQSTPSCSWAGGRATLSFATSINRRSDSCATIRKRCSLFGHSITSQTSLLDKFLQKTHGSATIVIMPR